ncbi:MAG: PEP-CTERM sorting domain-containing protein [Paludisphaera borealis]|uniref:PEP-CTERM sorting domain-containing protein n=1 Tax=Paludisphaera borealis TaxID=1387353 RepID=UPI00284F83E2|nr:PEP-CTERM sorting domain-containing protein [Paludisphaera borealis]MDR3621264.1 PEP-CTERM sorting domain-containing protein [Paludisphaera borealis]
MGLAVTTGASADVVLGSFDFNSLQFGDSLIQSDGGTFAGSNWLNTTNVDPGASGYLTGANFETGIGNIGNLSNPVYTILYNTAIQNGAGYDLGVVTSQFSVGDTITLAVSTDGGATFSADQDFGPGLAVDTGVVRSYFYNGGIGGRANLFVTSIDLSSFGIAANASINAVRITGVPELDLNRVAGFAIGAVPEPSSLALAGVATAFGLIFARRRRAAV